MMNISPFVLSCLLGLSLCAASFTGSADDIDQDDVLELRRSGKVLPLQRILEPVFERYPDMLILEVELEEDDGKYYYELEILVGEGMVRELEIDALSGEVVEDELED